MTSIRRVSLSFALAGLFSLWFVSADGLSGAERQGTHRTPRGYKVPVYGMSRATDASGRAGTECARLTSTQIERARFSRSVSRSMLRSSPRVMVQAVAAGVAFEVFYTDASGQGFKDSRLGTVRRQAFEASLKAWSLVLDTTVPIVVEARMEAPEDEESDLLASAGPADFWVFDEFPNEAVPFALAAQFAGQSVNDGGADIEVVFSPDVAWDYATHGRAAPGKVSFVYVTIHELAHGLGFVDSFDPETGETMNTIPFTYDLFVNRGSTTDNALLRRSARRVREDLVSDDLFFNGEHANEASKRSIVPKAMVKLFAPDPYEPASSVAHVDQISYSDFKVGLMTPYDFGSGTDKIDILTLGILEDLGYRLTPDAVTARLPKQ
jgi:hypothetical protein